MIKQNKTKLQFLLGSLLVLILAFTACNNSGDKKDEPAKDTTVVTPPPPVVKDSTDTMEKTPGNKAPGNDVKPQ